MAATSLERTNLGFLKVMNLVQLLGEHGDEFAFIFLGPARKRGRAVLK